MFLVFLFLFFPSRKVSLPPSLCLLFTHLFRNVSILLKHFSQQWLMSPYPLLSWRNSSTLQYVRTVSPQDGQQSFPSGKLSSSSFVFLSMFSPKPGSYLCILPIKVAGVGQSTKGFWAQFLYQSNYRFWT